ncbi:MAG: hypothetical protein EWV58_12540 [Microcystis aeruginosa Ma_MB_F_20061100_S19]|nr:MAG: hypothetical protein EWV59_05845 [Microcystis aeruginosa Ma_MB_F_20061100_S19D]TRU14221.1 MAG: hypothetical protein EWV58_12540 [Microcystis aeruginosa Ma_MB_F_20061100_S19]
MLILNNCPLESVISYQETGDSETGDSETGFNRLFYLFSPSPHTPHPTPHKPLANSCKPEIVH